MNKIGIIGSGSFGTAIACTLSRNSENSIILYSRNKIQNKEINIKRTNIKYFPGLTIPSNVVSTNNLDEILDCQIIFCAIPSSKIQSFFEENNLKISDEKNFVILSKGLIKGGELISTYLRRKLNIPISNLKGGSFANELATGNPTLFTYGYDDYAQIESIKNIFANTNIFLEYNYDVDGIEILSILKNIYAIFIGYIDSKYNSSNTRFMFFTKAYNEYRLLAIYLGVKESTLNNSCGIGDFGLTTLNDLSRNRTLGLLIGKGFYSEQLNFENSIVLEGVNSISLINDLVLNISKLKLHIFDFISSLLNREVADLSKVYKIFETEGSQNVLTYGTFDLMHYGHLKLLQRAKSHGSKIFIGLSTDEFNMIKGKKSIMNYQERRDILMSLNFVDEVFPENDWDQKISDVKKYSINTFIIGDDWLGKFDFLKPYCNVVYLPRTQGISTTSLKELKEKSA